MIDVKKPLRTAYFQLLSGQLTYNGTDVTVSDEITPPGALSGLYVILASQSGSNQDTFDGNASWELIDLDIVAKASIYTSKEPLDSIAGQILDLLFPYNAVPGTAAVCALPDQAGVQILSVRLERDRYLTFGLNTANSVIRRILTFKQYIAQT